MQKGKVTPCNGDDVPLKKVNNSVGWTIPSVIKLLKEGNLYFRDIRDKTGQNVFQINIGLTAKVLFDSISARTVFDENKVSKDPGFGRLKVNLHLTNQIIPSIFANGEDHLRYKRFLMDVVQAIPYEYVIKSSVDAVNQHFDKWTKKYPGTDGNEAREWEKPILDLVGDTVTQAILGTKLNPDDCFHWIMGILKKKRNIFGWTSGYFKRAKAAYKPLLEDVRNSPHYQTILKIADKYSVDDSEAINNMIFAIVFNSFGGIGAVTRGCAARIYVTDEAARARLIEEIKGAIEQHNGISVQALNQMKCLQSFILENLRMCPPVNLIFGRATKDLTVTANTGQYLVKKGEVMVANLYWAHRDPKIFDQPDDFLPFRFVDNPNLIEYIFWEAGPFEKVVTDHSHQCPGRSIVIPIVQIFCIYLLLKGEYVLADKPVWTGRKIRRLGTPDEPIMIMKFSHKTGETIPINQSILQAKLLYDEVAAGKRTGVCPHLSSSS